MPKSSWRPRSCLAVMITTFILWKMISAEQGGFGRRLTPRARTSNEATRANWLNRLYPALADLSPDALHIAEAALQECPADPLLLLLAALAAVAALAADEALTDAGLASRDARRSLRVGVCLGSTVGGTNYQREFSESYYAGEKPDGPVRVHDDANRWS